MTKVVDYGNQKYALLDVSGQPLLVEIDPDFKESSVKVGIQGENIEVWQAEIDMRLC